MASTNGGGGFESATRAPERRALIDLKHKIAELERDVEAGGGGGGGTGDVPSTRVIATAHPLTGGGDLSTNRTHGVSTFTSTGRGVVPGSGGGTLKYLRADGQWVQPIVAVPFAEWPPTDMQPDTLYLRLAP